jgi:isopentenyldiphosphate isomerase
MTDRRLNGHSDCFFPGDWHRAVHVWLYAMNTKRLLIQKRTAFKDSWPGLWDISSAGHSAVLSSCASGSVVNSA